MKKLIKTIAIATIILVYMSLVRATTAKEQMYTKIGIVTNQNEIVDECGECWGYSNLPYNKGTVLLVTFDNNGTTNITDDIIVNLQKK